MTMGMYEKAKEQNVAGWCPHLDWDDEHDGYYKDIFRDQARAALAVIEDRLR
jgi:hypothetical protein